MPGAKAASIFPVCRLNAARESAMLGPTQSFPLWIQPPNWGGAGGACANAPSESRDTTKRTQRETNPLGLSTMIGVGSGFTRPLPKLSASQEITLPTFV